MGFVSLAQPPRAGADSALTLAYFARRLGHVARARAHVGPPTLTQAVAWKLAPRRFEQDVFGLTPDDWQIAPLVDPAYRRCLVSASRQSGKSCGASLVTAHTMLFRPESLTLCVAPSQRQSGLLLRAVRNRLRASRCVPEFVTDNVFEIELLNGSRVIGLPASDETIRGYARPDLIIEDEASRIPDDIHEAVTAMQATNADTGMHLAISTPWGQRGWFWKEWTQGGESWARIERPATMCARISASFLARERAHMSEAKFRSEFLCEFLAATGEQPFPPALLDRIFQEAGARDDAPLVAVPDLGGRLSAEPDGAPGWLHSIDWSLLQ